MAFLVTLRAVATEKALSAIRRNARQPRVVLPLAAARKDRAIRSASGETLDEAVLRFQQAKADTEQLDAEKRGLEIAKFKRELIPAAEARDELEKLHLRWVAELDQLPHLVASGLPPEVAASVCDIVRAVVEESCLSTRRRLGASP